MLKIQMRHGRLIRRLEQPKQRAVSYYLSRSMPIDRVFPAAFRHQMTKQIKVIHDASWDKTNKVIGLHHDMIRIGELLIRQLNLLEIERYNGIIKAFMIQFRALESVYVVNEAGILVTDTLIAKEENHEHPLYLPCKKGDSVVLEAYYRKIVIEQMPHFISDAYLSMATGHLCYTVSTKFKDKHGEKLILCLDFNGRVVDEMESMDWNQPNVGIDIS